MKVLFVGSVNNANLPRGGEEYKNQVLYSYISKYYSPILIDTYLWKTKPLVLLKLFLNLFFCNLDRIIISASSHSVYQLLRIIRFFPSISKNTIYFVIGGYLPSALLDAKFQIKPYNCLKALVVEGSEMKRKMELAGVSSPVHVIPNFKNYPKHFRICRKKRDSFKFLFISRIHPQKGVREIIEASHLLNKWGYRNFSIVFFGPIEKKFNQYFQSNLTENLSYGGVLDIMNESERSYEVLSCFDAMLFPTYWEGEGFPGAVIDAFVVGLPVIASDWNMNRELVRDEGNGLLIPHKDSRALAAAMKRLMTEPELLDLISKESKVCAEKYHISDVWPKISRVIEN